MMSCGGFPLTLAVCPQSGLGQVFAMGPLVGTIIVCVEPRDAGTGGGTVTTIRQAGDVLGVALTGLLYKEPRLRRLEEAPSGYGDFLRTGGEAVGNVARERRGPAWPGLDGPEA